MRFTLRRPGGRAWAARAAVAALLACGSTAAAMGAAGAAQAQLRPAGPGTAAVVVHVATRPGFGTMLVTVNGGHALYVKPGGGCAASCRSVWPPLLMQSGATTPKGAACLATAMLGSKLQVTYHGLRLYTFTGDSGHSVNGNGVGGFLAAKTTKACP